jgi:uncharacterized membrane protein YecN with MAPEG domain
MISALLMSAAGVIIGIPIVLYGFIRLDERPGPATWLILFLGLAIIAAPVAAAVVLHQEETGQNRYVGR